MIVSFKTYPWCDGGEHPCFDTKMVKLSLFVETQTRFDASCHTLCAGRMHYNDVKRF